MKAERQWSKSSADGIETVTFTIEGDRGTVRVRAAMRETDGSIKRAVVERIERQAWRQYEHLPEVAL